MEELINKKCRIFVKNLSDKPIVYSGIIKAVEKVGTNVIITIFDLHNAKVQINFNDIIQIIQEEGDY